jgi:Uma2 family endonuclease
MTHRSQAEPLLFSAGDHLSREEFLAAWEEMPDLKFAELIDGVVYMPSPLSQQHGVYDQVLQFWVGFYATKCEFVEALTQATTLMSPNSAPQPDLSLRIPPEFGGEGGEQGGLVTGAPELVVEVAKSSRAYDLGAKLRLYERSGVKEYVAALVREQRLEWRVLLQGRYEPLSADSNGVYKSEVFPGLWLSEGAFWKRDRSSVLAVLEQGLQSPECAVFQKKYQIR